MGGAGGAPRARAHGASQLTPGCGLHHTPPPPLATALRLDAWVDSQATALCLQTKCVCYCPNSQAAKANFEVVRNDLKQGAMVAMTQVKQEAMKRLLNMRSGDQRCALIATRHPSPCRPFGLGVPGAAIC